MLKVSRLKRISGSVGRRRRRRRRRRSIKLRLLVGASTASCAAMWLSEFIITNHISV
jgi:hypothetical protein